VLTVPRGFQESGERVSDPLWTQQDIDTLRAAVVALASGAAVQTVSYAGPPARTVTYQPINLPAMRSLLAEMVASVRDSSGTRKPYRIGITKKGF
jgi:hypothetical protein